jgi:hypothetical protein
MEYTLVLDAAAAEAVRAAVNRLDQRRASPWLFLAAVGLLVLVAWLLGRWMAFEPGSDLGYNLGLAGGVMMLVLFLYPLRKRFRFMHALGPARHWFALHMAMGILGPLFVLVHSRFQVGSLNAGVALGSMCLVAGSGLVGRFIYTKIHHGLYGRRASLDDLRRRSGRDSQEVQSKLAFAPRVEEAIARFEARALEPAGNPLTGAWVFATLWFRERQAYRGCARELRRLFKAQARERHWDRAKYQRRLSAANRLVRSDLQSIREVAQFSTYERLFALWHVLHVPLVYMLILSAIAHVVAVHMY